MSVERLVQKLEESKKNYSENIFIGEIFSINPFKVRVNGIELENDQLKIATYIDDVTLNNTTLTKKKIKENLRIGDEVLLLKVGTMFVIASRLEGL